ncbi:MAG: Trigger factor [Candidatus Anoxychlamydiales bacterium]|nr:Trigger factor [Candidatus Anoxychlamydiales bacterium]
MEKDTIEIKIEKKPNCKTDLFIKASASLIKKAKNEAIKDLKKEVSIPGFRKGKAPNEMIEKKHPQILKEKWEKKIADLAFVEAHKKEKLPILGNSSRIVFNIKEYSIKDGAELSYSYETEPEIPKIDPTKFKEPKIKEKKVTKKEVDEALRQASFFFAKFEDKNEPVEEGDYLILDLESLDIDPPVKVFNDTRFEVTDKSMAQWMKKLVIGKKAGDDIEGYSEPDASATEKEKKEFQKKKVKIAIKKVEKALLPELNDEFAIKMGSKNVEDLKKNIEEMLVKQNIDRANKEKREAVNKFLLSYDFELPENLLKTEVESRKQSLLKDPSFKVKYDKMNDKDKKQVEKDLLKHSVEAIKIFYISKQIIKDQEINISDDEIKKEALDMIFRASNNTQIPDPKNIPKDTYALALSRLVLKKSQDYVLDNSSKS